MNKKEAEAIYDSGKENTVQKLLEYNEEIKNLKIKIAQLTSNSSESSKPPSSDYPANKSDDKKNKKSKRSQGGQIGHKGVKRELVPIEEVTTIIPVYPEKCQKCVEQIIIDDSTKIIGEPTRWQTVEIEPIKPKITEYQCFTVECKCGCLNKGSLSPEIMKSNFEPRLTAILAYMTAVLHVPRRGLKEFCATFLNIKISLGSIQNLLEETSDSIETTDKELKDELKKQVSLNADETSWKKMWLWVMVASSYIYFHISKSRGSPVLVELLGEVYAGILCVDRWGAYTKYHKDQMQICWAHLKRNFEGVLKIGKEVKSNDAIEFAETMQKLRKKLMRLWYKFKNNSITREELKKKTKPIIKKIKICLENNSNSQEKYVKTLAENLFNRFDHLFTFIYFEGIEPTNNSSERGLRSAVQWRKICFGNRSDRGAIMTARLLTVTKTCRLQNKEPLEFLTDSIILHRNAKPGLSLLIS